MAEAEHVIFREVMMRIGSIVYVCIALFAAVLLSAATCGAEQVVLKFDGRQWSMANQTQNEQQAMQEFTLKGESVNNWNELVTVQAFSGLQLNVSPEDYMNGMMKSLKQICPKAEHKLIRKGDNDIVFEWEIKTCSGQEKQYEIDRVIAGDKAMYVIHYATKKIPVSPETRKEWIKLVDAASLVSE